MSIQAALTLFLEEYPKAVQRPFGRDTLAAFIRQDVPEALRQVLTDNPRYVVEASAGQGNWAKIPWAAVFDRLVTESAQDGYYIVYLPKEDFSGIYLSLNQGVTSARKQYGADAKSAFKVSASDLLARLGPSAAGLQTGTIDLASTASGSLSAFYEVGSICAIYYPGGAIPADEVLATDLRRFVDLYLLLASRDSSLFDRADVEADEVDLGEEDLRVLREHKRIERNRKLAHRAKRALGYVCKACGFEFEKVYGSIGRDFIEAHHLTPLAELKGQRVKLDVNKDFTVLCANCHRMIHKTAHVGDVDAFRVGHLKQCGIVRSR